MRFKELNLLAYGKFTQHKLPFQKKAAHDFQVIIGPNEAGKSTVRRAITELLFGMELKSPLGFKHPLSDLQLSAVLETQAGELNFMRTKQRESLRTLTGEVLPDGYLLPALGALSEEQFNQMHCLDHPRLLAGGQGIVDPKNSVSQILFQAASGIEGFAALRDSLSDRAGEIFASRGRNNEYNKAADRYSSAHKELRDVQVRTREWSEAREGHDSASAALQAQRARRRELDAARSDWERARRLAPLVERLNRLEAEVQELGETIAFASGAKQALESGIAALNTASHMAAMRAEDVHQSEQQLQALTVDEAVLSRAADIAQLVQLSSRFANHERDLPLRRAEADQWLAQVLAEAANFGWGQSEADVRSRLPQEKLLRSIDTLLMERGALVAEDRSAREVAQTRELEWTELERTLKSLPAAQLDPQLAQALTLAQVFKTSDAKLGNLQRALANAQVEAQAAMLALGLQGLTEDGLRSMSLPSAERVTAIRAERHKLVQAAELAQNLVEQQMRAAADLELKIAQHVRSHKLVTVAEVNQARSDRDAQWQSIKRGDAVLSAGAPLLDAAIRLADELVDARTLAEADAAALQALRDQLETAQAHKERHLQSQHSQQSELSRFDERWAAQAKAMGLESMPLDDLPSWLTRRETALHVMQQVAQKTQELEHERSSCQAAQTALADAMRAAGLPVQETHGLAVLCSVSEEHIQSQQQLRARHQSLEEQLQAVQIQLRTARATSKSKAEAVADWQARWDAALAKAHLSDSAADVAEIEAAVGAAQSIRQRLEKIDVHRRERIETMESDLAHQRDLADSLRAALAPDLVDSSARELANGLQQRLEEAKRQSHRQLQAQETLESVKRQLREAQSQAELAQSALDPILKTAGVHDAALATPLVEKAHQKQALLQAMGQTRLELDQAGDGLTLEQMHAQVQSHPVIDASAQLLQLGDQLNESDGKLTELAQEELVARQAFDAINGGDQAALAEARRQEALADMSQASEEYLQMATASSLLKWAVDRYRERRQGPLLQRASVIFKQLTLGSFEKLRIDHDQTPPVLLAYRADNQAVKVTGLSDGTRDQLFLALRIAALELQADQGVAVPFVADDLFINFDDRRSLAGLQALYALSRKTQVLFLSHQEHLRELLDKALPEAHVIELRADEAEPSLF